MFERWIVSASLQKLLPFVQCHFIRAHLNHRYQTRKPHFSSSGGAQQRQPHQNPKIQIWLAKAALDGVNTLTHHQRRSRVQHRQQSRE